MSDPTATPRGKCTARRVGLRALGAGLLGLWIAAPAWAAMTVDLVWISTTGVGTPGSNVIFAEPGDVLTLEIAIIVDLAGVEGYSLSVEFDADFGDELDLVSTTEFDQIPTAECTAADGTPNFPICFQQPELINFTMGIDTEIESTPFQSGRAIGFEAARFSGDGPVDFRSPIGTLEFVVTENVLEDGMDLEGTILVEPDGYVDNMSQEVLVQDLPDPRFTPGFAPEPGPGLLAATALATLALLRSRQSAWV